MPVHETNKMLLGPDGAPIDRICGFETEYALNVHVTSTSSLPESEADNGDGNSRRDAPVVHTMGEITRLALGSPAFSDLQFRTTGERTYLDVGWHPEYSPPEETIFLHSAYRLLHGHIRTGARFSRAADYIKANPTDGTVLNSVDLIANTCSSDDNTWGSHENLLAPRQLKPQDYIAALAIHHLSRIVWSGAGHVGQTTDGHFRYELSEKAPYIYDLANNEDTRKRPLVHLRDRPLANPERFRRIHTICGESVINPATNALRLASGSIVLSACEIGVRFDDLMPDNPVAAIRAISSDPTLKRTVRLSDGRYMTGLALQQAILERSLKALIKYEYITPQQNEWADKWQRVLDQLASDPRATKLDWVVKRKLIEKQLSKERARNVSDIDIARAQAISYHQILPVEGAGLQLLRKGYFDDSPSEDILDNGLPLPKTRAAVRAAAIQKLREHYHPLEFQVKWYAVGRHGRPPLMLDDPYDSSLEQLEKYNIAA